MERELPTIAFAGEWRRYQLLALDAFERDRAAGRRHTHIVAPPGSGKTLIGGWQRWLGPSRLVFTQRSEEGLRVLARASAQASDRELASREIWA